MRGRITGDEATTTEETFQAMDHDTPPQCWKARCLPAPRSKQLESQIKQRTIEPATALLLVPKNQNIGAMQQQQPRTARQRLSKKQISSSKQQASTSTRPAASNMDRPSAEAATTTKWQTPRDKAAAAATYLPLLQRETRFPASKQAIKTETTGRPLEFQQAKAIKNQNFTNIFRPI
jgi:hypothetical protein